MMVPIAGFLLYLWETLAPDFSLALPWLLLVLRERAKRQKIFLPPSLFYWSAFQINQL